MTIDPAMSLAELVNTDPSLAERFDDLGVDFACGGHRTLGEVAADLGADPAEVVGDDVGARSTDRAWTTLGPAALVDHLEVTHHATMAIALPALTALAEQAAAVDGGRHPHLFEVEGVLGVLRGDLEAHMAVEEEQLFPAVRRAERERWSRGSRDAARELADLLLVLEAEHRAVGTALDEVRWASGGFAVRTGAAAAHRSLFERLVQVEADLHLHHHKENNLLFPRIRERLPVGA